MDFAEYLRKSDVSENSKVYYGQFLRNRLPERYCYIGKSRWDVQDLEKSARQSFLVGRKMQVELDDQVFGAGT